MQLKVHMISTSPSDLAAQLLGRYGPMLGGRDLYAALGFKSYAAFHRSKQRGEIGVTVFPLPGRRGWFALTFDVATWLSEQADPSRSVPTKGDAE
jgi:hypothetical protein